MPTMSCPNPHEMLVSFLILRLGLISEQQWARHFKTWPTETSSFGELLERQQLLSVEQITAVEQLAGSLLNESHEAQQQLARFAPPEPLLATLLDEPKCQSWLSPLMQATLAVQSETTVGGTAQHIDADLPVPSMTLPDTVTPASNSGRVAPNLIASHRYEVLRTHAEGGLGRVSLAEDRELRRNVALKQIKRNSSATAESRRRFVFEAEVTGQLEHPGIIPVYSLASDEEGNPFYTMRFVDGETLGEAIKRYHRTISAVPTKKTTDEHSPIAGASSSGPNSGADSSVQATGAKANFDLRQLLNRFVDLCNAIDYAHHRGFIHRDLKPSNVMLGRFGETLVVDWDWPGKSTDRKSTDRKSTHNSMIHCKPASATATTQA